MAMTRTSVVDLPLLPLGKGRDLDAERGVECPGDLPAASDPDLVARARAAKEALGERVFVLGHHYQRDEVIQFADVTGDSFKLARDAAAPPRRRVHRLLRRPLHGRVGRHPDLARASRWSCPTSPPAARWPTWPACGQVEDAWDAMADAGIQDSVVPVTYMNSSADIKAFCGRNGGVVCTSSNADVALDWAFAQKADSTRAPRSSSCPTSTSAATPRCSRWASRLDECVVWDPLPARRRPHRRGAPEGPDDPLEGPLLGARPLLRGRRRRAARQAPRHQRARPPRVQARGRAQGRPGRLDRVHHQDDRGRRARHGLGDRHRAQPGQAPRRRPPRQDDRLPRPQRLLLLDDEPHRPARTSSGRWRTWSPARWSTRSPSTPRPRPTRSSRSSGCSTCPASRTATERPARRDDGTTTDQRRRAPQPDRRTPRAGAGAPARPTSRR